MKTFPYHFQASNITELMQGFQHRYFKSQSVIREDHKDTSDLHINKWKQNPYNNGVSPHFEYINNSWGFRCDHTALPVDIAAFGCSVTYGVGVPLGHRWTDYLQQHTNTLLANYAITGLSTSECVRMFTQLTRFIQPKTAVFLLPEFTRVQLSHYYKNSKDVDYFNAFTNYYTWIKQPEKFKACEAYYKLPETYHIDKFLIDIHTICTLAEARGIRVILASWAQETSKLIEQQNFECYTNSSKSIPWTRPDNHGRDLVHPGLQYHRRLADAFINALH
jgi:hypothetical protein